MANEYLAMYLQITTELGKPYHTIPIMHFAENMTRLAADIKSNSFYDNAIMLGIAVERIMKQKPFNVSLLFLADPLSYQAIISAAAAEQMKLMTKDLIEKINPPQTAPTIQPPDISTVQIWIGMKNRATPKPKNMVDPNLNFTSNRFLIQFTLSRATFGFLGINNKPYITLTFYNITGQVIITPM